MWLGSNQSFLMLIFHLLGATVGTLGSTGKVPTGKLLHTTPTVVHKTPVFELVGWARVDQE